MSSLFLSVIIPAYNEELRIIKTLEKTAAYLDAQKWDYEIIVVDDGSTDGTVRVVSDFKQRHPQVTVLQNGTNRGKGYSVKQGMLNGRGEYLLFSDADLSAPIEEIQKLLPEIRGGCDVAVGSRALRGSDIQIRQPWYRELMGKIFNRFVRFLTVGGIYDTQCGFKLFRAGAAKQIFPLQRFDRYSFDVEVLWLARKYGYKVKEIPVVWRHQDFSRVHPVTDASRMLLDLVQLRINDCFGKYGSPTSNQDLNGSGLLHRSILLFISLWLGLWGIRWCLPSQDRLARVLSPELRTPAFRAELEKSWQSIYGELGSEPILNPKLWAQPFSGFVSVPDKWKTPPNILTNSVRSFFLRSGHDDEAPILVALSRIKPWRLELNPRIYTYGGLFMYLLGAWIAACMVLTGHVISTGLSFYLAHPDQMAWMYLSGRLFSVFHYVFGTFLVYFIGRELWNEEAGFWAGLFFAVSPGIVLQAHTIKPHLMGSLFAMGAFYFCARALRTRERKAWVWAGAMVGGAAGSAPYLGTSAGLVAVAIVLKLWSKRRDARIVVASVKDAVAAGCAAAGVFLVTNPFFIYQWSTSFAALRRIGHASSGEISYIWKFPLIGFPLSTTPFIALLVAAGMAARRNFRDPARLFALAGFILYLLNSWIMQTAEDLMGARNFPAFFLGFLLAGCLIWDWVQRAAGIWQKRAVRGAAVACAAYAFLTSSVLDYNLHLDGANRSTRHAAGEWIEQNIPEGSDLGFFRLPQPSGGVYFHWDKYKLTFMEPSAFQKSSPGQLPKYLVLTSPAYDQRVEAEPALDKYYVKLKSFDQFSWGGIRLPVGQIYGNPLVEIYSRNGG